MKKLIITISFFLMGMVSAQNIQFTEINYQPYFTGQTPAIHTAQIELTSDAPASALIRVVDRNGNPYGSAFFASFTQAGETMCLSGVEMPFPGTEFPNVEYPIGDNIGFVITNFANAAYPSEDAWISINHPIGIQYNNTGSPSITLQGTGEALGAALAIGNESTNTDTSIQFFANNWHINQLQSCGSPNMVALPIELSSFNLKRKNMSVELNWTTRSEENNEGFYIQRKIGNNSSFEIIGDFINSKGSNGGNSQSTLNYSVVDSELSGINDNVYYRLLQLDTDGEKSPTLTKSIYFSENFTGNQDILKTRIFPNPSLVGNSPRITFNRTFLDHLIIADQSGRIVYKKERFNTDALPANVLNKPGIYYISIKDGVKAYSIVHTVK